MKRPPLLIVLLVMAHGVLFVTDWMVLEWGGASFSLDLWLLLLLIVLLPSQIALMSMWLCLGQSPLLVRLTATTCVVGVWVFRLCANVNEDVVFSLPCLTIAGEVVLVLLVLRGFGFAVLNSEEMKTTIESRRTRFQFSIWQMLI